MSEWHDISEIDNFKDHYEFNEYVVLVRDDDGDEYTDLAFGIALFPENTKRFYCVPNDE